MRKAEVTKGHCGKKSKHDPTALAATKSGAPGKASEDSDTRDVLPGRTLVEIMKALGELRRKNGLVGIGAFVGFTIILHAAYAQWPAMNLILTLLAVAGFTLTMVLLQWFARWTNSTVT